MKNRLTAFIAFVCLTLTACQRPVAYFQRTPHAPATRLTTSAEPVAAEKNGIVPTIDEPVTAPSDPAEPVLVAAANKRVLGEAPEQVRQHAHRINRLLNNVAGEETHAIDQQPKPKPKPKMRLGNRIRDALGMPLREELNWWQRISWKLKASVIIILVAVLFAILHVTILAIIFGIVGAFLLISGLRRSFKVRRPWF